MIELESSVRMVIQETIAPEMIPRIIIGTVILMKVWNLLQPRLSAASSTVSGICCRVATELRIVYGILRIAIAMIMIAIVPVRTSGLVAR